MTERKTQVPTILIRRSSDRGHANQGWLDSYHTFSFGDYYDPKFQGFHDLLVINEDRIQPGEGFDTHGHRDMEIVTYVISGALEHKDSMGTGAGAGSVLRPGKVQRMSAGTGVRHSEFNHSKTESLHLLQIWITPAKKGIAPSYEEREFSNGDFKDQLRLIVSPNGEADSLHIHQNAQIYAAKLDSSTSVAHQLEAGRKAWVQVVRGEIRLNVGQSKEVTLNSGDGAAIENTSQVLPLTLSSGIEGRIGGDEIVSEFLLFDLPERS